MRYAFLFLAFALLSIASCTRRPVQQDLPSSQNSNVPRTADRTNHITSSPDAASAPYELQFIDTMIEHHVGAIDAAQLVATRAQRDELKQLARGIIADQRSEIADMKKWRSEWFANKPPAVNIEFPGMREGMKDMDLAKLDALKGNDFDLEFIRQMIAHHEGAITMAKDLVGKDTRPELKTLAENIIRSQTAEVEQMKAWQEAWGKR